MKKTIPIIFLLLLIPIVVSGKPVSVSVTPVSGTTTVEETVTYQITVMNNQIETGEFIVSLSGSHLEWASLGYYYVKLNPDESQTTDINFYPKEEGVFTYTVEVISRKGKEVNDSANIYLTVGPKKIIEIEDFSVKKIGNYVNLDLTVLAKEKRELEILFEVFEGDELVTFKAVKLEMFGTEILKEKLELPELGPGKYTVKTTLVGYNLSETDSFEIETVHDVVQSRKVVSNPLIQEVTITVRNQGNVVENEYTVEEKLPLTEWVDIVNEPTDKYKEDDTNIVYSWKFQGLMVGQETTISYTVLTWMSYLGLFVIFLCILGLLGTGYVKSSKPRIRKHYVKKRRNKHLVILEVKGSLLKPLKNVLVKDSVSPLGKVLPEFDGPRPVVRESESGTELIWRLGDLKARGEMILSYRIQPLLEASLKMPRAFLRYEMDGEKKGRVYSKRIILD